MHSVCVWRRAILALCTILDKGYDASTPTKSIVYHDFRQSEHGMKEWFKQRRERIRTDSLRRTSNCANKVWVPYDASISPIENAIEKATHLDPQPEFPLRTELNFFIEQESEPDKFMVADGDRIPEHKLLPVANPPNNNSPPFTMLLILWILGVVL